MIPFLPANDDRVADDRRDDELPGDILDGPNPSVQSFQLLPALRRLRSDDAPPLSAHVDLLRECEWIGVEIPARAKRSGRSPSYLVCGSKLKYSLGGPCRNSSDPFTL